MNTTERIYAVINELNDIAKLLDNGIPRPIDPPKPPTSNTTQNLVSLFNDPSRWSQPVQVWEFGEEQGGSFVPFANGMTFDQRRDGRKPRFIINGIGHHVYTFINGASVQAEVQDAKLHDGKMYITAVFNKEVYVGVSRKFPTDKIYFDLKKLDYQGAKDASHALLRVGNVWHVYGRLRHGNGVDWQESDPIMGSRRGVRLVRVDDDLNMIDQSILFDPAEVQPNYATNQMRYDYYASRACMIEGVEVLQISCFAKNQSRPIPNRPDRPDGSGHIYPIIAVDGKILSHTQTLVPTNLFERSTEFKNNHPFEPEIGQLYGYGITYDPETKEVAYYFSNRVDLHYYPFVDWEQPNVRIYKMTAKL